MGNRHAGDARVRANYLDALSLQCGDENLGTIHRFASFRGLTCHGGFVGCRSLHKKTVGYYKGLAPWDQSLTRIYHDQGTMRCDVPNESSTRCVIALLDLGCVQ